MMKKLKWLIVVALLAIAVPARPTQAIVPFIEIARQFVIRAIRAADLAIQRQQNKVIWLQNAQKTVENAMSKLKLTQISDWTDRQRAQYQQYFDELWRIKAAISYYRRIAEIVQKQVLLVREFERSWSLLRGDQHFTGQEIEYMAKVYAGILSQTVKNIDQMMLIISSLKTQMSDAKRLELINAAADQVEQNYDDLRSFNRENMMLSLDRSRSDMDRQYIKKLYGIK